jgi:ligand-binding sensor domain-containing protein
MKTAVRSGTVYAIAQDRLAYLWIGTDAGLFRFDGSRFSFPGAMRDLTPARIR